MFKDKKITIEIDTEELEKKVQECIAQHIENYIYNILSHAGRDRWDLEDEIRGIFRKAIHDATNKFGAEIRKEVKQEVINTVVDRMTKLDKKEIIKELIK